MSSEPTHHDQWLPCPRRLVPRDKIVIQTLPVSSGVWHPQPQTTESQNAGNSDSELHRVSMEGPFHIEQLGILALPTG